jgi:transcription elongation factor GreA
MSAVGSTDEHLLVTAEGYDQLRSELEMLRSEGRRSVSERLRAARADGDFDSNPALFDAIEEQTLLERRIAVLEAQLAAARVVAPAADGKAGIGSFVRVRELQSGDVAEYELVGVIESDVGNGRVSVDAPVGRALVDRRAGEIVEVETPRTTLRFEVLSVRPERISAEGGVTLAAIPKSAPVATRAA